MTIPTARCGAHRRLPRSASAASVDVHLRVPGWVAHGLYRSARAEYRTVSGTVALALVAHLDLPTPSENGGSADTD